MGEAKGFNLALCKAFQAHLMGWRVLEWDRRDAENVFAVGKWKRCAAQEEHKVGMRAGGAESSLNVLISAHPSCKHLGVQHLASEPCL